MTHQRTPISKAIASTRESTAIRPADMEQFFTCQHPDQYHPDWKGYYTDALEKRKATMAKYRHQLDVKYGESPYHIMDIFQPRSAMEPAPILLYFHGGRWREGHPAFYDCLADPWVHDGVIFVSCGYRMEPKFCIADAVEDALATVNWWGQHAGEHGGDPHQIIVAGHSAGGHLAAMLALTSRAKEIQPEAQLAAAILMSAVTDLTSWPGGGAEAEAEALSPAHRVTVAPPHVIVSYGNPEPNRKGDDDWFLTQQGAQLDQALTKARVLHQTIVLGPMDHVGTACAFADTRSPLYQASHRAIFGPSPQACPARADG